MAGLRPFKLRHQMPLLLNSPTLFRPRTVSHQAKVPRGGRLVVKGCQEEGQKSQRRSFLSLEEAGLVEMSGLNTHERFLCRLTISSLNLLRVITEQHNKLAILPSLCKCIWFESISRISSLNLLRVISEQEGVAIEELNAGRLCDWFLKDKLKREQDLGSAVIQWDDSDPQF
ncbi:hypothetical protein MUK42_22640 [Musa troglodytarum]|uniref:Uncharacterized protein n=1 Tax=Musa troglodytarum TaxID=320322 RepID=A0A9E7FWJ3_9LILI|nr:hypothetical protein MUK42_22640 [Musa troglodytarum]